MLHRAIKCINVQVKLDKTLLSFLNSSAFLNISDSNLHRFYITRDYFNNNSVLLIYQGIYDSLISGRDVLRCLPEISFAATQSRK